MLADMLQGRAEVRPRRRTRSSPRRWRSVPSAAEQATPATGVPKAVRLAARRNAACARAVTLSGLDAEAGLWPPSAASRALGE